MRRRIRRMFIAPDRLRAILFFWVLRPSFALVSSKAVQLPALVHRFLVIFGNWKSLDMGVGTPLERFAAFWNPRNWSEWSKIFFLDPIGANFVPNWRGQGSGASLFVVHPGSLFILDHCSSWIIVHSGSLFILDHCSFWIIVHPGSVFILDHCSSWIIVHPGSLVPLGAAWGPLGALGAPWAPLGPLGPTWA